AGDPANGAAIAVQYFRPFAGGHAAFGLDADALALGAAFELRQDGGRARKVALGAAALGDGPGQPGLHRIGGAVDVMAIEAKPRFEAKGLPRAETDGGDFGFG